MDEETKKRLNDLEEQNRRRDERIDELENKIEEGNEKVESFEARIEEADNLAKNHEHRGLQSKKLEVLLKNSQYIEGKEFRVSDIGSSPYVEGDTSTFTIADNDGTTTHHFIFSKGILTDYYTS